MHAPERRAPILIIDDNASKRLALRAVLEPLGYRMIEADSGAAGLRCVMADEVAVILLDVRMPDMDGFETAGLIRLRAQTELTPIIFVTAHAFDEIGTDRYAAGAVDFITGPVDPDELRAKVSVLANLHLRTQSNVAEARDLRASSHQLRKLTEDAPIGIFRTDSDNRYTYTNARWSEITGVSNETAVGAEWHVILDADRRSETALDFESPLPGKELTSRFRIGSGVVAPSRVALLTARPIAEQGRPCGWVGTLADITAEAEAEEALVEARDHATKASRLKLDFIANMSHEIRSPMTGVIGWTELLLDTDLDAEQRVFVETISRAGHTLMAVINAVLDFSKLEIGVVDLENIEFSVQRVIDDVVDLLSVAAVGKGIELTTDLDPMVPPTVSGDANRVRQVLTNLVSNAIKFTDAGQIIVRVIRGTGRSRDDLRFEVTDTGIGVAADKLEMIFEHFTQADTSVTREYGGTGLGLAISSRLTRLMGGQIGVTSELGSGSTFWFTIGADLDDNGVA